MLTNLGNLAGDIPATSDNGEINLGVSEGEAASVKGAETIMTPPAKGTSSTKAFDTCHSEPKKMEAECNFTRPI